MRNLLTISLSLMLVACAAPNRTDTDEFFVVASGSVNVDKVPYFVDCLTDGFNKSHWGLTNFEVRQSTRASGYRVETYTGTLNYLLVSADVFSDGKVVLHESNSAALINTNGEKETFKNCLVQLAENV